MVHEVILQTPPATLPYRAVVERYAPYVWHVARGVLRDPALAEDAVQEAFVALLARTEPFAAEPVLRTWLGRVACNAALKTVRSRSRRTAREQAVLAQAERGDDTMGRDEREWSGELSARVEELLPEERVVVRLKYVNGMPQSEIAEVLACSTGTVSNRLHAALASLRKALARGGLAAIVPTLETRLAALEPASPPSTLLPRLLRLEVPASPPLAKGGPTMHPTMIPKLVLSGLAVALTTALGVAYLLPGRPAPTTADPAPAVALAPADAPAAPRLAGRGDEAPPQAPDVREVPAGGPRAPSHAAAPGAPRPRGLRGVVTAPDGTPADGALVVVETPIKLGPHERAETRTGRDGTWELPELEARGRWVVRVRYPGAAPWRQVVATPDIDTRLHASWSVRGVVLDSRGEPVSGKIGLLTRTKTGSGGSQLVTDAEGRFTIADLDPKRYAPEVTSFELRHPAHLPARLTGFDERVGPDGWAFVEVRLEEGATLTGVVRDADGQPIENADLLLLPKGVSPDGSWWERRALRTDAEGRYAFGGLPDGAWMLRGRTKGWILETPLAIELTEREHRPLDLRFGRGRTLTGRVVDGEGRPIPGAEIAIGDVMDSFGMGREQNADAEGRFRYVGLSMERRAFTLFLSYLPLLSDVPLEVEVVKETPRALDVVIRTKALLPKPEPEDEEEADGQPVQVMIPSESVRVTFPAGE